MCVSVGGKVLLQCVYLLVGVCTEGMVHGASLSLSLTLSLSVCVCERERDRERAFAF